MKTFSRWMVTWVSENLRRLLLAASAGLRGFSSALTSIKLLLGILAISVPVVIFLLQSFSSATGGLPITVTTLSDTPTTGFCTLREAILNVNDPGIDHTEGDCAIDTGLHTIEFSLSGTITLGSTLPAITRTAIFDGTGQNIIVSGGNAVRVGSVTFTGRLTLMDITIANGKDIDFGGGFYNVGGTLNVTSGL